MKRAAVRIASARRPLARTSGYQACSWGCVDGLGVLRCAGTTTPSKGLSSSPLFAITQARNTSASMRRAPRGCQGSRWESGSGDRPFSSDSTLAAPGFRGSFVLRDHRHIKVRGAVVISMCSPRQKPASSIKRNDDVELCFGADGHPLRA